MHKCCLFVLWQFCNWTKMMMMRRIRDDMEDGMFRKTSPNYSCILLQLKLTARFHLVKYITLLHTHGIHQPQFLKSGTRNFLRVSEAVNKHFIWSWSLDPPRLAVHTNSALETISTHYDPNTDCSVYILNSNKVVCDCFDILYILNLMLDKRM